MNQKGGVRKYPLHRSPPAALSSRANSWADPKHKVHGADPASGTGSSSTGRGHPQGSKRWKEGWVYGVSAAPRPRRSESPRRAGAAEVLLLQWLWQQPTWQAAACTHCSLLFVHCQGKGAGGRAEGEEGTGNYKESTEKKKKKQSLQRLQLGLREAYTCCLQTPALFTHHKYLHASH